MNGRVFAGARALYRAAGVKGDDMGKKPIIAIANSFDEFLPGHVHLNKVGRIVSEAIKEAGGIPREFNTMAVDDGIAMGHTGMLYSLPSRDIIADTVEYQCNAHCADALICIPNCDKVVPGMLMAALRLNIPTVFVSGGPMEAGTTILADGTVKSTDLIDVMYATADDSVSDEELLNYEKTVCPTCGSCAGMFTANSMNCLTEAIGLALPGNGTILASHSYRKDLFKRAAQQVVKIAHQYYDDSDDSVLPRSIATKEAFENAMTMDVAMGGSTNTVLHILAMAQSADVDFTLDDIERISHTVPCICKASPSGKWEISDIHRAGGITGILGELDRAGKLHTNVHSIDYPTLEAKLADWDIMRPTCTEEAQQMYKAAPGHIISPEPWTHTTLFDSLDRDRANGAIHDIDHPEIHEGGLAVLRGNLAPDGCVVKTAGVPQEIWKFRGPALVVDSQEQAIRVLPVLLFVNAMRNQLSIPPTFINAEQLINLFGLRDTARQFGRPQSVFDSSFNPLTFSTTVKYLAFFAGQEWLRHMRFLEWDPKQAEQDAKDEDERKSREALAKKYNLTSDGDNAASDADLDSSADSNLSEDSDSSEEAGSEPTEE